MNQGEMAKLGQHGRLLRPLTLEPDSPVTPIGATGPATSSASRPARQPRFSLFPRIGTAAPGPSPGGKRSTATTDGGAAKREAGTSRPAGQAGCSRVPPIGAAAPAPAPRGKRATVTTDGGAARCIGSQMPLNPNKATGSQPQKMDQGEKAKLGKHGRTLRPLKLETYSKVLPFGAASPAPPSRGKREISDKGTSRPADGLSLQYVQLQQLLKKAREQLQGTSKGHPDQLAKRDAP